MSKQLVFATNNQNKKEEIATLVGSAYEVLNLKDIGCDVDIPETGNSFAENATLKSTYVVQHFNMDCFADDSGLEVDALNNEPGIFSARYSGVKDDKINLEFLLKKMKGIQNRKARFKTVISLMMDQQNYLFEGAIEGTLLDKPRGEKGFGYDPIFVPEGYEITFAEMGMEEKNQISHRAIATKRLIAFLNQKAG
ncbi:RdgB/HAM1 family non-canonical purine NTP pyrophosphatase [Pedobacter montanisoli]|uniref:dITP/XTP pyrophosphatase n=1 Tax=Pedobacter montanisoli TaxID=2923277 RepID=A0ABS9ZU35_9SPHI|nr:RdgB/HAM1 family non-canonical purine NTP pyrophosphatase [Pedobacter montanisoli]MCJ0742100.1 RdgB/HAM1 family non-canonical purine NTP pyrophosphatase [Pedobacter montanisoli]